MTSEEIKTAQEEMHQCMVIRDFGELVLSLGPNTIVNMMDAEAREELAYALRNDVLINGGI